MYSFSYNHFTVEFWVNIYESEIRVNANFVHKYMYYSVVRDIVESFGVLLG